MFVINSTRFLIFAIAVRPFKSMLLMYAITNTCSNNILKVLQHKSIYEIIKTDAQFCLRYFLNKRLKTQTSKGKIAFENIFYYQSDGINTGRTEITNY